MITAEVDIAPLEKKLSEMLGVMLGKGATPGEIHAALRIEAGQCAWKIAEEIGPKSSAAAKRRLNTDLRKYLTTVPQYSNLSVAQQHSSSVYKWLAAGKNWLLGIVKEGDRVNASPDEILSAYYEERKTTTKRLDVIYYQLGTRSNQSVLINDRIRVKKSVYNATARKISSKFGQSKAAWAATALRFLKSKRIPAWIRNQIPAVESNGKHVLNEAGMLNDVSPFIEFGSRAPGVNSNPKINAAVRGGIAKSSAGLAIKVRKLVAGQAYNWNTGQVFKPKLIEDN